jgi:hypothetical protein
MFTQADVNAVIAYNDSLKVKMFTVKNNKVVWDLRNGEVAHLNSILSKQLVTQRDFAQLKKLVSGTLFYVAMLTAAQQAA